MRGEMRSPCQYWCVFSVLLLTLVTFADSWIVDGAVAPVPGGLAASGSPKHEILVVRKQLRPESTRTDRLSPAARLPELSAAPGNRVEPLHALPIHPAPVDPAGWLGPRHLRSPS